MSLRFIDEYVSEKVEQGLAGETIANSLGISVSMVSCYKKGGYNPSLAVAKHVYAKEGITLHPFAAESLKYEIEVYK